MFRAAKGLDYRVFLRQLHEELLFDWYLEIGSQLGDTLAPVRSKTVAVDPYFRAEVNVIGQKPALHLFQTTSDAFFASGFLARNGIRPGLSFLDGMHLYEYLLRDFIAAEAAAASGGVILLHDCVPFGFGMTTRDLSRLRPGMAWTGDVWKLIPILQRWRPDLQLVVLDCWPSAIVCVLNPDPESCVLSKAYDAICAEWDGVELEAYGLERFQSSFEMVSAVDCQKGGFAPFRKASIDAALALRPVLHST
jgi:hypothetical protein